MRHPLLSLVLFSSILASGVAPAASAQTLVINGPSSGNIGQTLIFDAVATGCNATAGQFSWQVGGGNVTGLSINAQIQVTWNTTGTKTLSVFHPNCGSALGETTVTISDPGRLTFGSTLYVAQESSGTIQVSVLRKGGTEGAAQVSYSTGNFTAVAGQDYTATSGTLSWASGDGSNRLISIPVRQDTVFEDTERFRVTLSGATGAPLGAVPETFVDIEDDDPPPGDVVQFSAVEFEVNEDAGPALVTITRTGTTAGAISVRVTSADFSAQSPADFAAVDTVVNFAAGDSSPKQISIPIVNDTLEEGTEEADLVLSEPTPANQVFLGDRDFAELVIIDDDLTAGSIQFTSALVDAQENAGDVPIQVQRVGGSSGAAQVSVAVSGGSATESDDFTLGTAVLSWAAGETASKTVTVTLIDDAAVEGLETIELALSILTGDAVVGSPGTVVLRVADDDAGVPDTVRFIGGTFTASEGDGVVAMTVVRSGALVGAASVDVSISGGTATAGQDFQANPVTLIWANGEGGTRSFNVTVIDDLSSEPTETVQASLSAAQGASIGTPNTAVLRITDNDSGFIDITTTGLSLAEPDGVGTLVIERRGPTNLAASADFEVSGSALLDVDFTLSANRVEWAAGDSSARQITVTVIDDQITEAGESFTLQLVNVLGAAAGNDVVVISVVDDDFELPDPVVEFSLPLGSVRVAALSNGDFVQVWRDLLNDTVQFRLASVDVLASLGITTATAPDVAAGIDGSFVVLTARASGSTTTVRAQRFTPESSFAGGESVVVAQLPQTASHLRLVSAQDGSLAAAWIDGGQARMQLLDEDLSPTAETLTLGAAGQIEVASSAVGVYFVVWRGPEPDDDLLARSFDQWGESRHAVRTLFNSTVANTLVDFDVASAGGESFRLALTRTTGAGAQPLPVDVHQYDRAGLPVPSGFASFGPIAHQVELASNAAGDLLVGTAPLGFLDPPTLTWLSGGKDQVFSVNLPPPSGSSRSSLTGLAVNDDDRLQVTQVFEPNAPELESTFSTYQFTAPAARGLCEASTTPLCLNDGRFAVTALWQDFEGGTGVGQPQSLGADSGFLTFFNEDNVEIVLKVLDACSFTNTFWVYTTGLTNTEVQLVVDDVVSGVTRTYFNRLRNDFSPIFDIGAFATCSGTNPAATSSQTTGTESRLTSLSDVSVQRTWPAVATDPTPKARVSDRAIPIASLAPRSGSIVKSTAAAETCSPNEETLCLNGSRFSVDIEWATNQGTSGRGQARAITADTGLFTFFDEDNVEIVIKVLDACTFTNTFWVFAGGLTDVETRMVVTDTLTGTERIYENAQGQAFVPILDVGAFATCP